MIPDSRLTPQGRDWKVALGQSFRSVEALLAYLQIEDILPLNDNLANFPFRVTRHYASLIEKGNMRDPLLLQILPDARELHRQDGYIRDAVGDRQAMAVPGLIHKYPSRVLLTASPACAIHCRYCFRRHFPYQGNAPDLTRQGPVMRYLSGNHSIREVILSGGDPLMLDDSRLLRLIQNLNSIPHIRLLRIHSRLLSVLPERISARFIDILGEFNGQVVLVTHINHGNEIDASNRAVFHALNASGCKLYNQSVLLKRVNDDADALQDLSYSLIDSAISPYYLHRLDKVEGAAHFDISDEMACRIYRQLRDNLPGYLVPKMVTEIPGRSSKSAVHCS